MSNHSIAATPDLALTRRRALVASLVAALGPWTAGTTARAETNLSAAASFMKQVGEQLGTIVGGDTSRAKKQQQLQSLIDRTVAVDAIARFCLGRFLRAASPNQRGEYLQLFHSVLVKEVIVRLGDYQREDVHVIVGRPEQNGEDIDVPSTVQRTGNPPAQVTWVLQEEGGGFRIIDLVAEGVSMRLTVRSDYDSFLTSHDDHIPALLSALRQQAQQS
jgi:phospholipid transport system substrate-binding protein